MTRAVAAAYLACALIWGTTWYAIRACIAEYPTYTALALRFVLAVLLLVPIAWRLRPWPRTRRVWGYLVLAGVLDAGAYLLVYLGEERISGAIAAVLYGTQPLILALLLFATRIERITRRHLVGSLLSLAGVAVIFLDRLDVSAKQGVGVALMIGSVAVATMYSMIMKQQVKGPDAASHEDGVHGVVSTAIFLSVTAIVLSIVALVAREPIPWPPPPGATFALGYLAVVGTVVAFLLYFWLLGKTSLIITSTLVFVYPLVAIVVDALFERELPLGARTYLGAAITLGGLAVSLVKRAR